MTGMISYFCRLYSEWKYWRLPLEQKKNTLRYHIYEAEKLGKPSTIYVEPRIYKEDITMREGIDISGKGEEMSEWVSVKECLPLKGNLVEVRKSTGGILSPVQLISRKDECMASGVREEWIYKSGLFAGIVEPQDSFRNIKEKLTTMVPT